MLGTVATLGVGVRRRESVSVWVEDGFSDGGAASVGDSLRVWVQQDFGVEIATLTAVTASSQSISQTRYGSTDIDPIRLAYYRCARALEDLAYPAAQIVDVHRFTDRERSDALSIVRGVLSPTGLVNLALASAAKAVIDRQ